jgi:hypothetical protein
MKTILLITVCNKNKQRIENFITLLNFYKNALIEHQITPIFVLGKNESFTYSNYNFINVDVEEKYTNLYKKIFLAFKKIFNDYDFEYICKVDDDTFLNLNMFNFNEICDADYIGRIIPNLNFPDIDINLNKFLIKSKINIYLSFLSKHTFQFATGDCYFLSRRSVKAILKNEHILNEYKDDLICEDQLFGYLLKNESLKVKDINETSVFIRHHCLQVTKQWFSIHPIHTNLYAQLINTPLIKQQELIEKNNIINYKSRLSYFLDLQKDIKKVVEDFFNKDKQIGLG